MTEYSISVFDMLNRKILETTVNRTLAEVSNMCMYLVNDSLGFAIVTSLSKPKNGYRYELVGNKFFVRIPLILKKFATGDFYVEDKSKSWSYYDGLRWKLKKY